MGSDKLETSSSKRISGNTIVDAYKMDGTRLWHIDLEPNVRSGAATTNLLVFDFDGDGKAELFCKTGDEAIDGISKADWRTWNKGSPTYGKIVNDPEYITVFDGPTKRALDSEIYIPIRLMDGERLAAITEITIQADNLTAFPQP